MKIVTWNINGLRATKSPLKTVLKELDADVICFQETKITKDQLESDIAIIDGYSSYFSFSLSKQGYSGVATYCKDTVTPTNAQEGLFDSFEKNAGNKIIGNYGNLKKLFTEEKSKQLDNEGRTIITQHEFINGNNEVQKLTIFNVYCPRADPEKPERIEFKLDFYVALKERAMSVLKSGSHVLICGDINTSHRQIDHCDPDDPELFYDNQFREWMDELLYNKGDYEHISTPENHNDGVNSSVKTDAGLKDSRSDSELSSPPSGGCFIDTFRYFFPERKDAFTCWSTLKGCRKTNYGTRIDYILASCDFHMKFVKNCDIHPEIHGSDHCPVKAELEINVKSATKCPPCCTKYMTEFGGRQKTLSSFFSKKTEKNHFSPKKSIQKSETASSNLKRKARNDANTGGSTQTKLTFFSKTGTKSNPTKISSSPPMDKKPPTFCGPTFAEPPMKKRTSNKNQGAAAFWNKVLKGPGPAPPCTGHNEPSLLRTVKKEGPNLGRQFYVCCRPEGHKTNPEARCSFFQWKSK